MRRRRRRMPRRRAAIVTRRLPPSARAGSCFTATMSCETRLHAEWHRSGERQPSIELGAGLLPPNPVLREPMRVHAACETLCWAVLSRDRRDHDPQTRWYVVSSCACRALVLSLCFKHVISLLRVVIQPLKMNQTGTKENILPQIMGSQRLEKISGRRGPTDPPRPSTLHKKRRTSFRYQSTH